MPLRSFLLPLTGLLALGACSSTPMQYHTLIPGQPTSAAPAETVNFQLQLMPVRIPVQIDQPSLVVRDTAGRLSILEHALWASPPADEFHDALAFELESRLGVRDLAGLTGNPGQPVVRVQADVRRFDSLPGSHATLDVVWSIGLPEHGNQRNLTCASVIHSPASGGLDSLVLAHQRAIGKLADDMAGTLRRWVDNSATDCL